MKLDARAIARSLSARRLGSIIESYDEIGSTNTEAIRRAREGAPEGTVIVADSQRQGRGRLRRQWVSPPGCNLYCSIILRPALSPADIPLITLVAGLATVETVAEWVTTGASIKWPNDVVIGGRKVAGILTETESESHETQFVVVGIGVNVNARQDAFPPEVQPIATSLAIAAAHEIEREAVCGHLLSHVEARYDTFLHEGFSALLPIWRRWDGLAGRRVCIRDGGVVVEGQALGLAADGRLRVETASGVEHIVAGDVSVVGGYVATTAVNQ